MLFNTDVWHVTTEFSFIISILSDAFAQEYYNDLPFKNFYVLGIISSRVELWGILNHSGLLEEQNKNYNSNFENHQKSNIFH